MNVREIKDIMAAFAKNELTELNLEKEGFSLNLKKEQPVIQQTVMPVQQSVAPLPQPVSVPQEQADSSVDAKGEEEIDEANLIIVNSPIIGTFYRASNPDAKPYVNVGDNVSKGQVLCIIEAMKIMNEIESEVEGTIVKIYAKNAEAVEFGQKLFAIKPN
jgi:acetyl-CoA carboxylase biotin carboxyl carrier protein